MRTATFTRTAAAAYTVFCLASVPLAAGPQEFIRGDANDDGSLDIADAILVLEYLFSAGSTPACLSAADVNDDDVINLADPIHLLGHLFGAPSGPAPAPPFPSCGADPTPGSTACAGPLNSCPGSSSCTWNSTLWNDCNWQ
jgi:hypothetical protein